MSVQCEQVQELVFWFRCCLPSSHDFDCVRVTAHNSHAKAVDFVFLNVQDKHVQVDEEEDDEEDVEEEVDSAVKSTILSSSSESESLTREMTSMIDVLMSKMYKMSLSTMRVSVIQNFMFVLSIGNTE